ncbi:otoferlin isoform X5 [Hydra vulgaris]|uniref:Otoferlin isoform X5 n=2 Tax=Hydra vulgaris TaxID=6087 RepID=A0ABM4BT10_HYDVU
MSTFAIYLKWSHGLNGRHDRIARATFRGKTYTTDVYEFCSDADWEEEFDWPVTGSLKPSDFILVQVLNYNKLLPSRVIGTFQMYLKKILSEPWISLTENLVDSNSTILASTLALELMYVEEQPRETTFQSFHPPEEKMRVLEDWELESLKSNSRKNSRFSLTSSMKRKLGSITSKTSSKRAAMEAADAMVDGLVEGNNGAIKKKEKPKPKVKETFHLHPKVHIKLPPQRKELDVNVEIRVIEGKSLAGTQLDPVCDIICFGETKSTQVKEQTNTPYWDEFFVFATVNQLDIAFDEILQFIVYSGRNLISKGAILGSFKTDLGTVYSQPDHRFIRKFACLTHPDETLGASGAGVKGYLKLDITVMVKGDPVKEPPSVKDSDDDVDLNPLLPEGIKPERMRSRFCVRIYKAEGLPKMNSGILANIKKQFTGETRIRDLADPFVKVSFAGLEARTSVKKNCYEPEWNEEIVFCDLFPSLCRRIKIQLKDQDLTKEETIGTLWIDLSEISNDGCNVHKFNINTGFMPTFGPSWVNLYGSTRDYWFINQNDFLNEGLGEGIGYRGRILLSIQMEEGESAMDEEISNVNVRGAVPVSDVVGGKEEKFQLFCCIHEASMIDRKTASNPIQFEMNIGNYGNTFDGKMLSSKEDDDGEDDDDKFTKPLTDPMTAETLDREYYNMPYHENKPCMHLRFPWEDHRKRLYLQNILHRFVLEMEDSLEDTGERLAIDADDTWEYLKDAVNKLVENCNKLLTQLGGKITGAKLGKMKLDKERLNLCISETKQVIDECKQILDNLKDNRRINSNYRYVLSFIDRYKKLMKEPQDVFPDIIIWLLSGNKRICYTRIPAHKVMYSRTEHESGVDAGKVQTYLLTLPGKSGLGENGWAIKCKLTCLVWLGILKTKKDMLLYAPEGFEIPKNLTKTTAPPPLEIHYTVFQKFSLRAHMYQARGLIGSDDSGLSDAFGRVILSNQAADTSVVWETRSPTWNQTLIFNDLVIYGEMDFVVQNPPIIMAEIFDYDEGGDIEFIGRAMCRPLVKQISDPYDKPFFPPRLEWFQIYRGDSEAGELLAAFELFQLSENEEENANLPSLPIEVEDEVNGGNFFLVPENIRPVMCQHRIECLFWGVRELKAINFQAVERPQVEFECVSVSLKSPVIVSAKKNPNFTEPWGYFDLDLPEEAVYCPPLTISLREMRMFGNEILVGTSIINSLLGYMYDSSAYIDEVTGNDEEKKDENPDGNAETKEDGAQNEEIKDETNVSLAGSKKLNADEEKIKTPSIAPSKSVSFAPGSKKGSPVHSLAASKLMSNKSISPKNEKLFSPKGYSPLASVEMSLNQRRRSVSPSQSVALTKKMNSRRVSNTSKQSSQIHYHIISNPGTIDKTPLKKIFTPRKTPQRSQPTSKNLEKENTESNINVTPFKQLISKPATPLKYTKESVPLLQDISKEVQKSPGQKLMQQIATPLKSISDKIVSPIQKSKDNQNQSPTQGTPSSKLVEIEEETNVDDAELKIGAEASDFVDPSIARNEEGDEEGEREIIELDTLLEGKVSDELGPENTGDPPATLPAPQPATVPVPPPVTDDEEKENDNDDNAVEMKVILVGEDELKAEEEAEAAEKEEEKEEEAVDEEKEEAENEDQIDWWARFYETVKDEERLQEAIAAAKKKKKLAEAKKGKKAVILESEDGEENIEDLDLGKKKIINPRIIRLKIYKTELEEVPNLDGLCDVLQSWVLLRGKSNGNDDDDESRIYGKFKGAIKVWKFPLPSFFYNENNTLGSFKRLPSMDPINVLCRIYVVKAIDLKPTDMDGKADPYVKIAVGKHVVKDRDNYVPKQLNPTIGRTFDFEVTLPHDNMLVVSIYDYDLVGSDDLIGETKIDIENRFFSKHRAICGLSTNYDIQGFNKWRDPIKPTAILQRLCKDLKLDGPHFTPGKCRVEKWVFCAKDHILDDNGNPKQSDEPSALKALHNFSMIEGKGYVLVPEHVETRSLLKSDIPGIEQGRIQLWIDLFSMEGPAPGAPIDITPRKPISYELRCIIWNTEDVILGDINILTGQPCADIYVKGWIEGLKNNSQSTDVHTSSLTGEGNFNWRFIFPFKFYKAEERVVILKKASLFSWDMSEEKVPARLVLQCWDSDTLSSDDFIGDLTLNLTNIPRPSKTSVQCNMEIMSNENRDSIFKKKLIKGWWPFIIDTEESDPELVGKVEVQLELLTEVEAAAEPAGLGRKEPQPLPFPNRPDVAMQWMANPLKALRYFLWEQYKFCFGKFVIIGVILAIMGLFMYTMPDAVVGKLFGGA